MVQIISIKNQTAVRAIVIANRIGSAEIDIMKAMMIALLKEKLKNGICFDELVRAINSEVEKTENYD